MNGVAPPAGRALVTGGAGGIGAATARRLAARGDHVVVADVDEPGGRDVANEVGGTFVRLDVGDPTAWEDVEAIHGPISVAVLNAGISTGQDVADGDVPVVGLSDEAYRRIMAVNVDGVVFGTRAVLAGMLRRGAGDIVVTASLAGLVPIGTDPVYGLTKHAVVGFVRSMAVALEGRGIAISAVCPGFTDTAILGPAGRRRLAELGLDLLAPEDVAAVVARAVDERANGAQWTVWPGQEAARYEWAWPIPGAALGATP